MPAGRYKRKREAQSEEAADGSAGVDLVLRALSERHWSVRQSNIRDWSAAHHTYSAWGVLDVETAAESGLRSTKRRASSGQENRHVDGKGEKRGSAQNPFRTTWHYVHPYSAHFCYYMDVRAPGQPGAGNVSHVGNKFKRQELFAKYKKDKRKRKLARRLELA